MANSKEVTEFTHKVSQLMQKLEEYAKEKDIIFVAGVYIEDQNTKSSITSVHTTTDNYATITKALFTMPIIFDDEIINNDHDDIEPWKKK